MIRVLDFFLYHLLILSLNYCYILWVFGIQLTEILHWNWYIGYNIGSQILMQWRKPTRIEVPVFTFQSVEPGYMYLMVCRSLSILSMLRSQDVVQLVNCPCISLILNFTRSSCYLIIWKNEYSWSKRKKKEIYNKNNNLYRLLKDSCLLIGVCYTRQRLVYIMGMNQCFISSLALMQIGSMPRMFT